MAIQPPPDNQPKAVVIPKTTHEWGELSKHKIATIRLCSKEGVLDANSPVVSTVLTDGDFAVESSYQSPFESSNPETKLPNLMGMVQSGQFISSITGIAGKAAGGATESVTKAIAAVGEITGVAGLVKYAANEIAALEGKSNLTKINSTQIFVSTAPIRLTCTLFFMALHDAKAEVETPLSLLQQWALPIELSKLGLVEALAGSVVDGLFPSKAPPFVAITYGGKTYAPFLLENVAAPVTGPMDRDGNRLNVTASLTLASRQAWDANDINTLYGYS
jgi:hypothetical protein